jgi:hypothetical protein
MKRIFQNEKRNNEHNIESKSVQKNKRIIKKDKVKTYQNDDKISTLFLIMDQGCVNQDSVVIKHFVQSFYQL